jgi:hypothetical protein
MHAHSEQVCYTRYKASRKRACIVKGRGWEIPCRPQQELLTRLLANFFETRDLIGLRTFAALNNVEFNLIAFFETLIALALDGAVMNEDVGSALAAEEAVAFSIVEPLYGAFILCQWSHSLVSSLRSLTREVKVLQR